MLRIGAGRSILTNIQMEPTRPSFCATAVPAARGSFGALGGHSIDMALPQRGPGFYRSLLALPLLMFAYLLWSGRLNAYWQTFASGPPVDLAVDSMVTAGLWLGAIAPLILTAWVLGAEHTAARRMNYSLFIGLGEVVRRARGGRQSERSQSESSARAPKDSPRAAVVWGVAVAVLVPLFFASFGGPDLRTPLALAWLGGTGLLMGAAMYCRRRAVPYIRDEPGQWDVFREWRLLNTARYDKPGRLFVRWQIRILVIIPFWWLGGGAVVLSMQRAA
jgi:preprotein translocase subunit Sec61beta